LAHPTDRYAPRVPEFLSREWLAALDDAARGSDRLASLAGGGVFVIEQRVTGGPAGEVAYQVVLDGDGGRVVSGAANAPDVIVLTDYATGLALHRGETNAQHAFAAGRMKVRGEIGRLLDRADALRALDDVFASVRARTTASTPDADAHR
jgi:hypothetical protein